MFDSVIAGIAVGSVVVFAAAILARWMDRSE